jgi:hypothetical protein
MKEKKIEAAKKRKNIRQKGGKLSSAIFVATKDDPQKRTAITRARYVSSACLFFIMNTDADHAKREEFEAVEN